MPTTNLFSLGHMAVALQQPVSQVRDGLAAIGVKEPALTLDLVEYFPAAALGTLICRAQGWTDQAAYHRTFHDHDEVRS